MHNTDEMVARAEKVIDALTNAFFAAAEAAAERLELGTRLAQVRTRMTAFSSVLESISARKEALYKRLEGQESSAIKTLLQHEIDMLQDQEIAVLRAAGMTGELKSICSEADDKLYRRQGKRFVLANGSAADVQNSSAT